MSGIYLKITGDPAALYDLADWLAEKPSKLSDELHQSLKKLRNDSTEYWSGQTGDAFRETVDAIARGVDPVDIYAADAAEVFRAFAGRLKRGKDTFQDYADSAAAGRLIVSGDWITMPLPPPAYASPEGPTAPPTSMEDGVCVQPWAPGDYDEARELFNGIAEDVGIWWSDLMEWIDEHFVPLINRVTDCDELSWVLNALGEGNNLSRGTAVSATQGLWAEKLRDYEVAAAEAREAADTHTHRRNSGDPATRNPALSESQKELNAARDLLDEEITKLKFLKGPIIGVAIDVVAAGVDVLNGGSISSAVVGTGAGIGVGIGAGAGLGAATALPPVGIAVAAGFIAWFGGWAATNAWEGSVPLDIREAIDAGDWDYVFS
ncbi:hypothetical protein GCM10022198_16150 [Klugiella xanthotipulae]|uniref:Uncharacterized protein n=1 Tax=Klugiella xanthotipulae TaxID=244735 RepID=A0A543HH55_9MICO|nr:hypothetical protein [Klugiella xanthotipulae]TQM57653.1 hypothetical protein FB466_2648 [Klugiella xanthotipulae]